jgi:hydrogenase nickel incorporation protein HypB
VTVLPHDHHHDDHDAAGHVHANHDHDQTHSIQLEQAVLAKNDHLAAHNRDWFGALGLAAINVMSSPGSGKTTLLERTIRDSGLTLSVIEGDQETTVDAERHPCGGCPQRPGEHRCRLPPRRSDDPPGPRPAAT